MAPASKRSADRKSISDNQAKLVKDLADILDEASLTELEYETETVAIRLSRVDESASVAAVQSVAAVAPARVAQPTADALAIPVEHPGTVKSPMVGTVYTAPEPDAPAFISEGDRVSENQTILIVEAMKVMNPITAPKSGTVVKIFVQNAQPVEFGEALVIVE